MAQTPTTIKVRGGVDPALGRVAAHLNLDLKRLTGIRAEWHGGERWVTVVWDGSAKLGFETFRQLMAGEDEGAVSEKPSDRDVLAAHFIMWQDERGPDDVLPPGAWVCSCGLRFAFSDTAIDHQAEELARGRATGGA